MIKSTKEDEEMYEATILLNNAICSYYHKDPVAKCNGHIIAHYQFCRRLYSSAPPGSKMVIFNPGLNLYDFYAASSALCSAPFLLCCCGETPGGS